MTKEEFYNDKGEKVELHKCDGGDFYTNPKYWDCECDEGYIHKKTEQKHCTKCDTFHEEQPDSRQNEIDDEKADEYTYEPNTEIGIILAKEDIDRNRKTPLTDKQWKKCVGLINRGKIDLGCVYEVLEEYCQSIVEEYCEAK